MTPEEANRLLDDLRAQVDTLDLELLALFNRRAQVVGRIGDVKREAGIPIYEPKREEEVFRNVLAHNEGPHSQPAIRRLFERIIDESRALQRERMEAARRAQLEK
jgi:chorismate mutase